MAIGISLQKGFWVVNTWRAPGRKRLKRSTLNFAHTLLHKTVPAFFLTMSNSFYYNNSRTFESAFCIENNSKQIFQKISGNKNIAGSDLFVACLLAQELIKKEKQLTLIFLIFGKGEKSKLYMHWKLVLVHLRRYKNMYIVTLSCFLIYIYFAWKGTLSHKIYEKITIFLTLKSSFCRSQFFLLKCL